MRRQTSRERRIDKRERMRGGRIAMAVSKKDSRSFPSSKFSISLKRGKSHPKDDAFVDYDDMNYDQIVDPNLNEDDSFSDFNSNGNGNSNIANGNSHSNSNGNPNSNKNNNLNANGQSKKNSNENSSSNSNDSSNSNSNSNPSGNSNNPSNSNSNNNSNSNSNNSPNSNSNNSQNSNSNSNNNNSNSNSNTNSPSQSGSPSNNNTSPSNSGNGGNNNSTSPSPPVQQNSNNNSSSSNNNNNNNNNNTSPPPPPPPPQPSPPKGSGRPMFSPPHPALSSGNSSPSKSSSNLNTGLLAGVLVGAGMLFMLLIVLVVYCCKKRRRKKKEELAATMKYFPDDQKGAAQQQYYNNNVQNNGPWHHSPIPSPLQSPGHGPGNQQQHQHQHQHPHQHHQQDVKTNNYSGGSGMASTQHWGPVMPPPPPPNMMTSEMGAGPYSSGPVGPALPPPPPPSIAFNKSAFTYDELSAATNGFSQANMIGQGGFGFVYKGVLPNGKEIAVKSLKSGSGQGEREFQAEVEIISRVHHRHLVSLVGYCIAGGQRMLVYEFIPNKTLEYHLHGKDRPVMDFPTRMKIALGAAKGLAYLHEDCHPRIIHRDIKGANILIDHTFEAKVADFGLAKLSNDNFTHVSTRIMGTFGYLAPEYAASGKLTDKSDVFSFGIMLLELVTGKRPIDNTSEEEENLVEWAMPLIPRAIEDGVFDGLADPRLEGKFDAQEMKRLIACAGAAIRHSAKRRPKMSQIVRALEGDMALDALYEPAKASALSGGSSDYDNTDMSKLRKTGPDSTGYSSSDTESGSLPKRSPGPGYV